MKTPELELLARQTALAHGIPAEILLGMIDRESQWDQWDIRYEPGFMSKYVASMATSGNLTPTEAYSRCFSWGLLQLMGEDARELGFKGPLSQLCDPAIGLEWGCREFARILKAANGDIPTALERYNGGGNPKYAAEVLAFSVPYKVPPPVKTV